jgi:mannose-6-phosphate isomerase-like protein (cupin superfamily)
MQSGAQKEKIRTIFDLDDFRQGKWAGPNEAFVYGSSGHRVSLWTLMEGQSIKGEKEPGHERMMIVMGGIGEYHCRGQETMVIDEGIMIVAPPGASYTIKNTGNSPLVIVMIECQVRA